MTDNLPAVPDPRPTTEVATTDTDSWVQVMAPVVRLADHIADTEFVPKGLRGSAAATAAAMLYGREVGLPPMTALTMTHVVEGKPGISAEGMRALVLAAGHDLEFIETTGAVCRMRARRRGGERWTELTWTLDMARAAGLAHRNVWKAYPRVMLQARCTTELCRMVFPDVIHGFRSVEELEDQADDGQGAAPAVSTERTQGTRVARKRPAAKKAAAAPRELAAASSPAPVDRSRPAAPAGPPLPGEEGYDELAPRRGGGGASGDGPQQPAAESGQDSEDAPPAPAEQDPVVEDVPAGQPGEHDPVDEEPPADDEQEEPEGEEQPRAPRKMSRAQGRMIMAQFGGFGLTGAEDRDERLAIVCRLIGREVESSNDLTSGEASRLVDTLGRCKDRDALYALMDELDKADEARS